MNYQTIKQKTMGYQVENKSIKWGVFTSKSVKANFERYVIEDAQDLEKFLEAFPQMKSLDTPTTMMESLAENRIIIATDPHWLTGFCTYCYESKKDDTHVSAIKRVYLGKIKK